MINQGKQFFKTTRGKIVASLRKSPKTVNELMNELGITDNAVRAHLLSLERDNIVKQIGTIKGARKPHYLYGLAEESRILFPAAYDSLLSRLLTVLKESFSQTSVVEFLRKVGRSLVPDLTGQRETEMKARISNVLNALSSLGGSAHVLNKNGDVVIESDGCPFAEVVRAHPETCVITQELITGITGEEVVEQCDRSNSPKCRFIVRTK